MDKRKIVWKIVTYSIAVIIIAGLSTALALAVKRQNQYRTDLENMYEKSFYDTMTSVSLVGISLDKLSVASTNNMQKMLLGDICRECERASSNLGQLSTKEEPIEDITKFLNQLGGYCNYLSERVEFEDTLTTEEGKNIKQYARILNNIWISLQSVQEELMKGGRLMGKLNGELNYLASAYHSINNSTEIEFPEINYDGPFSDDVIKRKEPEALKGKALLSAQHCQDKISTYFGENLIKATLIGQSGDPNSPDNAYDISMPNYTFNVELKNNQTGTLQISKQGGLLINYQSYKNVSTPTLNEEQCISKASDFLHQVGYTNMKSVWTSNYNSILYVNFVYEHNNIIVYPDMIKVKIACDTGDILGFEAQNYLYNHKSLREYSDIKITEITYNPSSNYSLKEKRIAIIPTDYNQEKTVAEYVLTLGEEIYYVYVSINSFEEERILKQIDDDGKMLV